MTRDQLRLALAMVSIGIATGSACSVQPGIGPTGTTETRYAISETPNAKRAYLIIGANVLPADKPQPTWIGVSGYVQDTHLSTAEAIFELPAGTRRVDHVDFQKTPKSGNSTISFNKTRDIQLKAGAIYYYGRVEIEGNKRQRRVRTVLDSALYRRACEQAPEHLKQFSVVMVGPLAEQHAALPTCDELSDDSGS